MEADHPTLGGLWLPLVTPFRDGSLDESSLRRLVRHYAREPLDGLVLAATTGEGLTLDDEEVERLVAVVAEEMATVGKRLPIFLGLSGSDTRKVAKSLGRTASWPLDGYLIACSYYTRPSQEGMTKHFAMLAQATVRPVLIYNIPYRTGVNLGNEAMLDLTTRHPTIVGVKDCSADMAQSFDLLRHKPSSFSVLTGEDAFFHPMLTQGAEGGILTSAHIDARALVEVRRLLCEGDPPGALRVWHAVCDLPRLLFAEPSPAPVKHWLWRVGLIASPEVRLPMTPVSDGLAIRIGREVERAEAVGGFGPSRVAVSTRREG